MKEMGQPMEEPWPKFDDTARGAPCLPHTQGDQGRWPVTRAASWIACNVRGRHDSSLCAGTMKEIMVPLG